MQEWQPILFLVDDDSILRQALTFSLENKGLNVAAFSTAQEFLDSYSLEQTGCLVLDLCMPGKDGLVLQQELIAKSITLPIIFISGTGAISHPVEALKAGAIDFLEKPIDPEKLHERVIEAFEQDRLMRLQIQRVTDAQKLINHLTPRELEVFKLLVADNASQSSKDIARALDISHRTVEAHRAQIMEKTHVRTHAELIKLAFQAEFQIPDLDRSE